MSKEREMVMYSRRGNASVSLAPEERHREDTPVSLACGVRENRQWKKTRQEEEARDQSGKERRRKCHARDRRELVVYTACAHKCDSSSVSFSLTFEGRFPEDFHRVQGSRVRSRDLFDQIDFPEGSFAQD